MDLSEKIRAAVDNAVDQVNAMQASGRTVDKSPGTVLVGDQAVLDSLGVVNLIVALEQQLEDDAGISIPLTENPDLMDRHLTGGRSRSIPVVMVLDQDFEERGWWGPRPGPIQDWVVDEGLALESGDRYKVVRRFYARDKGRTTLEELLELMGSVALAV